MDTWLSDSESLRSSLYVLAPVLAALMTGVAIGWFIWGGERDEELAISRIRARAAAAEKDTTSPTLSVAHKGKPVPDSLAGPTVFAMASGKGRFEEIERELAEARQMLKASAVRQEDFAQDLSTLDAAVKRAAGRVALITRGLKA